jgi:hypothetical protein
MTWHIPDQELRAYAGRALSPPLLWSAEAHLVACAGCRDRLATLVDPGRIAAGWSRLDAELDAPRPGPIESALLRLGIADHTARLLAATPVLRLSWLSAIAVTLALGVLAGRLAEAAATPALFLAIGPLLPLLGVAISFGPGADPTHELSVVSPMHTLRLLLLRSAAVLSVTTAMSGVASLALPEYGVVALAWFLPALAVTVVSLALTPRLGARLAVLTVGSGWLTLVATTVSFDTGGSVLFTPAGQAACGLAVAAAITAIALLRTDFDISRRAS